MGKDYMFWKFKRETMLKVREWWGLVDWKDVKSSEGEGSALFTYMKRQSRALNLIMQSMSDNQLLVI